MAISVGVVAAVLVVWAGFIEIDDRTRVGGRVIPAAETRTVSHPEGGTVAEILVKDGDRIRQGDPIAKVGATGRVSGPHLDWRMNLFGNRLDPQLLVDPMEPQ